jgi:hypothetical protein
MQNRALRRHHEERVKQNKRSIAKRWAGDVGKWVNKLNVIWGPNDKGKIDIIAREKYIDRRGATERLKYIERTANRLAHHNKCPCYICKRDRYDRRKDAPPIDFED